MSSACNKSGNVHGIKEFYVMALADDFTASNQWKSVKNK